MNDNTMAIMNSGAPDELMNFDYDNILAVAERADKMVHALKKIIAAAIKITTDKDWVLIGGSPYLQESGATKVARLFGISWQILEHYAEYDSEKYPTYTYRIAFTMGSARIECDGSRTARDDFFAGARVDKNGNPKNQKSPDEIDIRDVRLAAYTNCLNNGIKRLVPGLRNIDIGELEAAGLQVNKIKGYIFKDGSKGGTGKGASESGLACSACKTAITQAEASFSEGKYGQMLCRACQAKAKAGTLLPAAEPTAPAPKKSADVTPPPEPEEPAYDDRDAPPPRR